MHQIRPKHLFQEIINNMRAGLNTMIWGGPGTGKSEIPYQVADRLDQKLLEFRANLFDPVDVRGVPRVVKVKDQEKYFTSWAVPDVFPIAARDGERGLFFIDELPTAPPATQNAFFQQTRYVVPSKESPWPAKFNIRARSSSLKFMPSM